MAEVEKTVQSGEMAQSFIQFIMLQAQNVLFVLGKIPTPEGATMSPNLHAAKMLIDQLEMIKFKTKGNINAQEAKILDEALSSVQLAFVEVSGTPVSMMPKTSTNFEMPEMDEEESSAPAQESQPQQPKSKPVAEEKKPEAKSEEASSEEDDDHKKKYFKSYG